MIKMETEKLLKVSDYVKEFCPDKTRQTVYNWIKSGKLKTRNKYGLLLIIVPIR